MSCRETKGGSLALRMARMYSGLSDSKTQALFHALQREGRGLPPPSEDDLKEWRVRQRALIDHADLTEKQREQCERDYFRSLAEMPDGKLFHAWSRIEVRARQESILENITTAVDLDPPGSQSQYYELDSDGNPTKVWYASYGSNMHKDRFLAYIKGGSIEGSRTIQSGARDDTDPMDDIPIRFDGRMHFAYVSSRWGYGGVAFMDTDHAGHALGRAYLITGEQFEDVVAQENGRIPTSGTEKKIPYDEILNTGKGTYSNGIYGTLIHIGDYKCAPVITFTGSFTAREALVEAAKIANPKNKKKADTTIAANEPSGNYLRMIAAGLEETFDMSDQDQADYLRGCGGAEEWTRRGLLATLRAPEPTPVATPNYHTPSYAYGTGYTGAYWREDTLFSSNKTHKKKKPQPSKPVATPKPSAASLAAVGVTPPRETPTTPNTETATTNKWTFGQPQPIRQRPPLAPSPLANVGRKPVQEQQDPPLICAACGNIGHTVDTCEKWRAAMDGPDDIIPTTPIFQEPTPRRTTPARKSPTKRTPQARKPRTRQPRRKPVNPEEQ